MANPYREEESQPLALFFVQGFESYSQKSGLELLDWLWGFNGPMAYSLDISILKR
jgi:hypothetical protein